MHYSYKKMVSGRILGEKTCPHCEKSFRAVLSAGTWVFAVGAFLVCVLTNFVLLRVLDVNATFISIVTLFLILPACAVVPLTIRYKDRKGETYTAQERNPIVQKAEPAPISRKKNKKK